MKAQEPTELQMRAHRAMVRKFCSFICKIVRHSTVQSNRHALTDMEDTELNPYPRWQREHCRALQAYLSSVSSFSDGGSGLPISRAGCCGEGSSDSPANDRDRGREH